MNAGTSNFVFQGGSQTVLADGMTLANLSLNEGQYSTLTVAGSGTSIVLGSLTIDASTTNPTALATGGTIAVSGDVTTYDPSFSGGTILIGGSSSQTLTGPTTPGTHGFLPSITIASKTGPAPLTITGNIGVTGSFLYQGVTLASTFGVLTTGSDIAFFGGGQSITPGTMNFANVDLAPSQYQSLTINGT